LKIVEASLDDTRARPRSLTSHARVAALNSRVNLRIAIARSRTRSATTRLRAEDR